MEKLKTTEQGKSSAQDQLLKSKQIQDAEASRRQQEQEKAR